jgi:FkbM family methyltransferase
VSQVLESAPMNLRSSFNDMYAHPYNRMKPLSALRRRVAWKIRSRNGKPWVEDVWGRKAWFYPDSRCSMFLAYNHVMDWPEFKFLERYLQSTDTVIDIGANIGIYVLWMSKFTANIIAFEPDAANALRLQQQIDLNKLTAIVERCAVSNVSGTVGFSTGKDMENHIVKNNGERDVQSVRLDDYSLERIHFLKVDVEGAELLVLQGAERLLSEHRVDVIQLEFNSDDPNHLRSSDDDVPKFLERHGYKLFQYSPTHNQLTPFEVGRNKHSNALAVYDPVFVAGRISPKTLIASDP